MCPGAVFCNRQAQDLDLDYDEIKENAKIFYMMKHPSLSFSFKFIEMTPCCELSSSPGQIHETPQHSLGLVAFENISNEGVVFHSFVCESNLMRECSLLLCDNSCKCHDADFPSAWRSLRANLRKKIGEHDFQLRRNVDNVTPTSDESNTNGFKLIAPPPSVLDENYMLGLLREEIKETTLVWLSEAGTLEAPAAFVVTTPPHAFVGGCATAFVGEVHKHHEGRSYCIAEGSVKDTRAAALDSLLSVVEQKRVEAARAPARKM